MTDPYSSTHFNIAHESTNGNPIKTQDGTLNIFEFEIILRNNKVPSDELACGSKQEYSACIEDLVQNVMKNKVNNDRLLIVQNCTHVVSCHSL